MSAHLGKMPVSRINKIRDAIFSELMNEDNLLFTEILYYVLRDNGVPQITANRMALKIHNGGKIVNSAYLKEQLLHKYKSEHHVKQITAFVRRHMKSTRIEEIDAIVSTWQMNGFSTHELPYIAGYKNELIENKKRNNMNNS